VNKGAPPTNVAVGASTIAGYSVTAAGLAAAIIAYATGARDAQTLGVLTASAVAILAFLVTQAGRYAQAHTLAKGVADKIASSPTPTTPIGVAADSVKAGDPVRVVTGVMLDKAKIAEATNKYNATAPSVSGTDAAWTGPDAPAASDTPPGHQTYPAFGDIKDTFDEDLEGGDPDSIPHITTTPPDQVGADLGDPGGWEPAPDDTLDPEHPANQEAQS
jgi:hypothetical protein